MHKVVKLIDNFVNELNALIFLCLFVFVLFFHNLSLRVSHCVWLFAVHPGVSRQTAYSEWHIQLVHYHVFLLQIQHCNLEGLNHSDHTFTLIPVEMMCITLLRLTANVKFLYTWKCHCTISSNHPSIIPTYPTANYRWHWDFVKNIFDCWVFHSYWQF